MKKSILQGDRVEHPEYIIQNKLCPICNIVYNYQLDFKVI